MENLVDNTLVGTLPTNSKKKNERIRVAALNLLSRGEDPAYVRYHLYRTNPDANIEEIDNEINTFQQMRGGGQPTDPNAVEVGGRTHEIRSLSDEVAYQNIKEKKETEEQSKDLLENDLKDKLFKLEEALSDEKGMKRAVGSGVGGRGVKLPGELYTDPNRSRFVGAVNQIIDTDALDALIEAKSKGATFGSLSDTEMKILKSSATKIGNWQLKDGSGYQVDEETFQKELAFLKEKTAEALKKINTPVGGEVTPQQGQPQGQDSQLAKFNATLQHAQSNPEDPKAQQFLQMIKEGKIDPTTGGLVEGSTEPAPPVDSAVKGEGMFAPEEKQKTDVVGFLSKVGKGIGSFLGGDEIGEAIGNKWGTWKAKNGEAGEQFERSIAFIEQKFQEGKISQEQRDKMLKAQEENAKDAFGYDGPNFKQVAGDMVQAALTVATAGGVGSGATKLAPKIAKGAALGYGFDVATDMQEDESLGEIAKPGIGTAIGGAIPILGAVKNAIAKGGKAGAERVMNSVVKPDLDDLKKSILYKGKSLGQEMLDDGLRGTKRQLLKKSATELTKNEEALQKVLSQSDEVIKREELLPYLAKLKKTLANTPTGRAQKAVESVDEAINLLPEQFSLSQANVFKRNLYRELRDLAYKIDPNLTPAAETSKAVAHGLKELIESKAVSKNVATLNQRIATNMKVQDGVLDQLARTQRNNLAGVGTRGAMIEKTIGATVVKTYGAAIVNKAAQIIEKSGKGASGNLTKAVIMNAIQEAKKELDRQ